MKNAILFTSLAVLLSGLSAHAGVITLWNFNSTTPDAQVSTGTLSPAVGTGVAAAIGGTTTTFVTGSPGDALGGTDNTGVNVTTFPAAAVGSGTAGIQFSASTVGFSEQIQITLDVRQSATASRFFQLQASSDGTVFTNVSGGTATLVGPTGTGNSATSFSDTGLFTNTSTGTAFVQGIQYTFAIGSVFQNNPNFAFRFVSVFDPAGSAYVASNGGTYNVSGTVRFDQVTVASVPEPATALSLLSGAAILLARRRRRAA